MKLGRLLQIALIAAAVMILAASASASTITWNTAGGATSFITAPAGFVIASINGGTNNEIIDSGAGIALYFTANPSSINSPAPTTNVDLGDFELLCTSCSSGGTAVASFTFDIFITDTTDTATGIFVGTSSAGNVTPTSSNINISWTPLQLGPGTSHANSGNFGTTYFQVPTFTAIVAPNSGSPAGDTSVQGVLGDSSIPEPATMAMVGGLLIGLAALARKRRA